MTRLGRAAAISVLFAVVLPLGIARAGASGWQPPQKISGPASPNGGMDVGLDRAGNAVAAWLSMSCGQSSCVRAARLPVGETKWAPAQTIATAGFPRSTHNYRPEVGQDRRGQPLVVWSEGSGSNRSIRASSFARGRWARPWILKRLTGDYSSELLRLVTNERGNAALAWVNIPLTARRPGFVEASARLRSGRWLPTQVLSEGGEPSVAIDRAGNAVAVWPGRNMIASAILRAGSSYWSRPRVLGRGACPRVAADGRGNFVAAWAGHNSVEVAIRRARSGAWGPTQVVAATRVYCGSERGPSLAVGRGGMIALAWSTQLGVPGGSGRIQATRLRPADGQWEPPRIISRSGHAISQSIAIDHRGTIFVIWEYFTGVYGSTVEAVVRGAASAEWPSPVQLAPTADTRRTPNEVVARGKGRALAPWVSTPFGLEIAEFDGR